MQYSLAAAWYEDVGQSHVAAFKLHIGYILGNTVQYQVDILRIINNRSNKYSAYRSFLFHLFLPLTCCLTPNIQFTQAIALSSIGKWQC